MELTDDLSLQIELLCIKLTMILLYTGENRGEMVMDKSVLAFQA
jgi:hypothetical protein